MTSDSNQEYISKERLEQLKTEIEELKTVKRQEISKRIEDAKKFGDLSENAEYMEAKESQEMNERKIQEAEQLLKNAVIIEKTKPTGIVQIGSTVLIKSNGAEREFTIVGSEEADPVGGKISNQSPLGASFLGKKEGDEVEVKVPAGIQKFKIVKIK